jgi:hypothetical protein
VAGFLGAHVNWMGCLRILNGHQYFLAFSVSRTAVTINTSKEDS